jgi:hypothetical protein
MFDGISQSLPPSFRNRYYSVSSGVTNLNNTTVWFTICSIDVGRVGVWFAWGQMAVSDTATTANIYGQLNDGVRAFSSGLTQVPTFVVMPLQLGGIIVNPKGPIRMQANDSTSSAGGVSQYSGAGWDTCLRVWRIG